MFRELTRLDCGLLAFDSLLFLHIAHWKQSYGYLALAIVCAGIAAMQALRLRRRRRVPRVSR